MVFSSFPLWCNEDFVGRWTCITSLHWLTESNVCSVSPGECHTSGWPYVSIRAKYETDGYSIVRRGPLSYCGSAIVTRLSLAHMAGHHFGSDNGVRFCCPGVLSVFIRTCVDSVNDPAPPPIVSSLPSRSFVLSEAAFWLRRPPRWLLFGFVPYRERACVEDVADSSGLAALISIVSAFALAPCGQGRVVRWISCR